MPPTLLNLVLGDQKADLVKNEYQSYDDYQGEVVQVGTVEGTGSNVQIVKDEPVSY